MSADTNLKSWVKLSCHGCGTHLGVLDGGKLSVRYVVRQKTFQVYTIGGASIIRCRHCGKQNLHMSDAFRASNPEDAARLAERHTLAVQGAWLSKDEFEKTKKGTDNA